MIASWQRGTLVERDFPPVEPGEKWVEWAHGPGSNTGQKCEGALIDFLTLVIPADTLEARGLTDLRHLLGTVFGFHDEVVSGAIRNRQWQFYPQSAVLVDREGELVGRVGLGGAGETVCVSLSGAGCKWVRNWHTVAFEVTRLGARISRVDLAFDDYDGKSLDVHDMRERAFNGEFAEGGRPPRHRFVSDEGHDTGSTLYVGGKGHKELCVYEKGKQLGMKESPWVRAEVRLYGKHVEVTTDVLLNPLAYLLGSYSVLQRVLHGVCSRLKTLQRQVEATGTAWVRWMRRQVGPSVHLLMRAFGPEWAEFAQQHVARDGSPGRFRGVAKGDRLAALLREELSCQSSE